MFGIVLSISAHAGVTHLIKVLMGFFAEKNKTDKKNVLQFTQYNIKIFYSFFNRADEKNDHYIIKCENISKISDSGIDRKQMSLNWANI